MKRNRGSVMTGANAAIATILTNYWEIRSAAAVISAARTSPHPPDRCVIGVLSAENPDNATVKPGDRSPLQALRSSPGGAGSQGHSVESEQTDRSREIGRASCREREEIEGGEGPARKTKQEDNDDT